MREIDVMKVLVIHEVNYLEKVIFEMHEFPELLALRGHDITFFHYPENARPPRVSLRTTRTTIPGRAYPGARIDLVTPPTFGGRALERVLAPLLALPALSRELRRGGYDAVLLYAVPTTGWQTVSIARRAGVPVLFRALDVSHLIRGSVLAPLIKIAERHVYRAATFLSANNPALRDYCVEFSGRTGPSGVDLPPLDLSHFESGDGLAARQSLGLSAAERVVLYMGTFFGFSGLDVVLEEIADDLRRDAALRFVLVGGGELDGTLRRRVGELGLERQVIFTGVVDYARLPDYLAMADVTINPFRPELTTDVALPHKVLQYMAAGIPVVSTHLDGLAATIGEDSGATWVPGPAGLARVAVDLARTAPEHRARISERQRAALRGIVSIERAVTALENRLRALG